MQFKMAIPRPAIRASSFLFFCWGGGHLLFMQLFGKWEGETVSQPLKYNMGWHLSLPLTSHQPELSYMSTCNCKEVGKWNPRSRWQGAQLKSGESLMIKKGRMNIEGQLSIAVLPLVVRIVSFKDI